MEVAVQEWNHRNEGAGAAVRRGDAVQLETFVDMRSQPLGRDGVGDDGEVFEARDGINAARRG